MLNSLQAQRFNLRKSLLTNRHQQVSSTRDSFDRVKVLSPSLADCLLQRTTQDRTVYLEPDKDYDQDVTEALEKMTFYSSMYENENVNGNYVQSAQPYLRSSMIDKSIAHLFMQHSSQPRLRSIKIKDDVKSQIFDSKVFHKFGPQVQSFTYEGILPFVLISAVDSMSRLVKLKIDLLNRPARALMVHPNVERIIPWHQLSVFSLRCHYTRYILECALLEQLGQMTQLRKLSIELPFLQDAFDGEEIKQFLTEKFNIIPNFPKLEVLRFEFDEDEDTNLDYRFLVGLLARKLGETLTKLIFQVTDIMRSTSNCVFLDYSKDFPHLKTLVLNYQNTVTFPNLYERKDKLTLSQSIRHLAIINFKENIIFSEIFKQIPAIFPNLVELNFKPLKHSIGKCYCSITAKLTDSDLMEMISGLPSLRTLRFMDDYPKFRRLLGSIELMCKRATELKPKVPMLFQVPLGNEFEYLKYSTDQLPEELKHNFYCWDKAAKWIRLY